MDLDYDLILKKYSVDNNVTIPDLSEEKVNKKCKKLAHFTGKPAESFVDIVKCNPHKKWWKLTKLASELNLPESVSIVIESKL